MLAAKMISISNVEEETDDENARQEPQEPVADRGLCERVDGAHDSTARQEGSQNGKHERAEDQPDIPGLQHATFFLHHHRVQERSSGEPWENRGVLNRVPSPISAPT